MFRNHSSSKCVLCGAKGDLTGEHKLKRTLIQQEYGNQLLFIGDPSSGLPLRKAQGPKSKAFHYSAGLCANCNGSRTQQPDRCFDRFRTAVKKAQIDGASLYEPLSTEKFSPGSDDYLGVFRFFAKHMCCQIAQREGAPIPIQLAAFAIGQHKTNNILLNIRAAAKTNESGQQSNQMEAANLSHGGLIIIASDDYKWITGFHSSLSAGRVQYVYWIRLGWLGKRILRKIFHEYCEWALQQAMENPLIDIQERRRLGLEE